MSRQMVKTGVLTPEVQAIILQTLMNGGFLTTACDLAGVTYRIFRHWQARWEKGDPDAQKFDEFFSSIKKANAVAENDALIELKRGESGWQAKAWFLERRFPARWAIRKEPVQPADISKKSDEELNAIAKGKSPRRT